MKTYEVILKNKSIISKNNFIIKADNFINTLMSNETIFIDDKGKHVAMFDRFSIEAIITIKGE